MQQFLMHSFPRKPCEDDELQAGCSVLLDIVDNGLLLTPEELVYPLILGSEISADKGTRINQLRACFTYINESQLLEHSANFGSFSLRFDLEFMRKLGAFPVIYTPQPVGNISDLDYLSRLGNSLIHQIRDISSLLGYLTEIDELLLESVKLGSNSIKIDNGVENLKLDCSDLRKFLTVVGGKTGHFETLLNFIELMSHFFYHTNRYAFDDDEDERKLVYYRQQEWRIVSGIFSKEIVELPLCKNSIEMYEKSGEFFSCKINTKTGLQSRASLCRLLKSAFGKSFYLHVDRFYLPDCVYEEMRFELSKRGINGSKVIPVPYDEILSIRS